MRLIQASQYLSQFNFNVKYKPNKLNIIPNVLSHLFSINNLYAVDNIGDYNELNALNIYNTTLVKMGNTFA